MKIIDQIIREFKDIDEAITIIDRGTGEIVIETRATIGDICQYYLGQNIPHPIIILLIYV